MYTVSRYPQGAFSWADCSSTDAEKAKSFYSALMGWQTDDLPIGNGMVYTMFKHDGHTVAAISQGQPGMPSAWNNYITVEDVDAMPEKIRALGGTVVMEPMDVLEEGRMLVLQDPTGAYVSLWQPKNHIGAGLVNTVGAMCWNELATRDVEKAKAFFGDLLGWTYQPGPTDGYTMIMNGDRVNGGILQMTDEWEGMMPHWMVYFTTSDVDAAAAKVAELGGQVHVPPTDIPAGRFMVISDPAGAVCTIMNTVNPDPWIEGM